MNKKFRYSWEVRGGVAFILAVWYMIIWLVENPIGGPLYAVIDVMRSPIIAVFMLVLILLMLNSAIRRREDDGK